MTRCTGNWLFATAWGQVTARQSRGIFPTDEVASKLIHLSISDFEKTGGVVREWVAAKNQFAILRSKRFNR